MSSIERSVHDVTPPQQPIAPSSEAELWQTLLAEALRAQEQEALLRDFFDRTVLRHPNFATALAALLGQKLADRSLPLERLEELARTGFREQPQIIAAAIADLSAIRSRDPASGGSLTPFLYYKGFHALDGTASAIGSGAVADATSRISCRAASRKPSPSTFTRPCRWAAASSSTTAPASLSARPRSSATTFRSFRR